MAEHMHSTGAKCGTAPNSEPQTTKAADKAPALSMLGKQMSSFIRDQTNGQIVGFDSLVFNSQEELEEEFEDDAEDQGSQLESLMEEDDDKLSSPSSGEGKVAFRRTASEINKSGVQKAKSNLNFGKSSRKLSTKFDSHATRLTSKSTFQVDEEEEEEKHRVQTPVDPSVGLDTLPHYFLGGSSAKGFETLLGDALRLLIVARHGLKENELFSILGNIRERRELESKGDPLLSAPPGVEISLPECYLAISSLVKCKGKLEELMKSYDAPVRGGPSSSRRGLITFSKALNSVESLETDLKVDLVSVMSLGYQLNGSLLPDFEEDDGKNVGQYLSSNPSAMIHYPTFLKSLTQLHKKYENLALNRSMKTKVMKSSFEDNVLTSFRSTGESITGQDDARLKISLGPLFEDSFCSLLSTLGVLHTAAHHVLLLPLDNVLLRDVIKERYVNSPSLQTDKDSVGERYWHDLLIQYFQGCAPSLRRCEELPWHLQICRRWFALRDEMSDLETFDFMFQSDLKSELTGYWLLLTEGRLYVDEEAEKMHAEAQGRNVFGSVLPNGSLASSSVSTLEPEEELRRTLSILDSALVLGLTEKEYKMQLLQNLVAPFDVVEELNKALEDWVATESPPPTKIHAKILDISVFLKEFAHYESVPPSFLRLGVDMNGLNLFGINLQDLAANPGKNASTGFSTTPHNSTKKAESSAAKFLASYFPTPSMVSDMLMCSYPILSYPCSWKRIRSFTTTIDGCGFSSHG
jgi:hypothetical protein